MCPKWDRKPLKVWRTVAQDHNTKPGSLEANYEEVHHVKHVLYVNTVIIDTQYEVKLLPSLISAPGKQIANKCHFTIKTVQLSNGSRGRGELVTDKTKQLLMECPSVKFVSRIK